MYALGESGTVRLGATMNAVVGLTVLTLHFRSKPAGDRAGANSAAAGFPSPDPLTTEQHLSFGIAVLVAAVSGLVALGYEILWYRAYAMAFKDRAPVFAALLGFYLAGVAFGSLVGRSLCHRMGQGALGRHLRSIALFVILANLVGYLVLPAIGFLARYHAILSLPLVSLAAALLGATFPLITHAAVKPDARAGRGLSWLYLSNIIGCTLGSFIVGYVLMNIWTVRSIAIAIALVGLALGAVIAICSAKTASARMLSVASYAALSIFVVAASGPLFRQIYERLEAKRDFTSSYVYRDIVESRSGVAAVTSELTVFGGGCYDGKISTGLIDDKNMLFRPFSISYWHPAPRDVMVIGLATGAWTQVIAGNPEVEKVTVVEINPGYLRLIAKYPEVRSLLGNPKVSIDIDDGRRWLVHNRDAKFDVIVSNTTYHERAHISNLLSVEFLQLIREHLKPGGVFFYNLTNSLEAQLTGLTVFPYGMLVGTALAVSDSPFQLDIERWKRVAAEYKIEGKPVFDWNDPQHQKRFDDLIRTFTWYGAAPQGSVLRASTKATRLITDDNMGTEWRGIGEIVSLAFHF